MNEQEYILFKFETLYAKLSNKRIAIYGVGANTKYILENGSDLNLICGLIDRNHAGEDMYGYHVFSEEEIANKCDVIIIIARSVVLHIIYKRIKWMINSNIKIYNVDGEDLSQLLINNTSFTTNTYWDSSIEELKNLINVYDIISFDIFDTLLMRKVIFPTDVFKIVEREYYDTFKKPINFSRNRIKVERTLNKKGTPTLDNIYSALDFSNDDKNWLKQCEINIERRLLLSRKDIVECLNYSVKKNKIIIIVSDMYYTSEIIESFLLSNNIIGYNEIIISCEYGATKETGELFSIVKNKYKGSILHIGDNIIADIKMAKKFDINTYYVMSAYEMMLNSSLSDLLINIETINDSLIVGDFAAIMLNSPFSLCKEKGRLFIDKFEQIIYFFIPILLSFLQYIIQLMFENNDKQILFFSRDGYLIHKLYNIIIDQFSLNIPKGKYILSSRAALCNDTNKDNYLVYFKQFIDSDQTFVFDWVTKGTSVSKLEELLFRKINKSINLICFASFNIRASGFTGQIHCMLGDHNFYHLPFYFLKYYELIEIILPPPFATQLLYFDKDINPVFADESSERSKQWDNIQLIQSLILNYFKELNKSDNLWYTRSPSIRTADTILGLISSNSAIVDDKIKSAFVFESHSENIKPTQWWDQRVV
jgi:FMN phosphatase YigB (HAD superfamily)